MVSTLFIKFWGKYIQFISEMGIINIIHNTAIVINGTDYFYNFLIAVYRPLIFKNIILKFSTVYSLLAL